MVMRGGWRRRWRSVAGGLVGAVVLWVQKIMDTTLFFFWWLAEPVNFINPLMATYMRIRGSPRTTSST